MRKTSLLVRGFSVPSDFIRERPLWRIVWGAVAGLAIGFAVVPRLPAPEAPNAAPPRVTLLARELALGDGALDRALDRLREHLSGSFALIGPDTGRFEVGYSDLGVAIDTIRLRQLILDASDRTSPLRRAHRSSGKSSPIVLPVPLVTTEDLALGRLRKLKAELDQLPRAARIDVGNRAVVPHQDGRKLDLDASLARLHAALERGATEAPLAFRLKKPTQVTSDLGNVGYDHVLGFFETHYDRSERAAARTFNLDLAASRLDGTVLLPGEIFDFNEVVGPRDEASGYKVAPVIAQGELVDGMGGGTCQISGTLHGAVFFAGLEIVERYPHTRPSSYIKMGLDAAVVYPTINFRFRNPYPFPIVIHQTVAGGTVRAEIRGSEPAPSVRLIRRIEAATTYDQVERADPELASGRRVLIQRGVPGFQVRRYRIVQRGAHAERERWQDLYPPTTQIVAVGTAGDQSKTGSRADDPHPEYLADELLILTQENGDGPRRELGERRDPGRFGVKGWTAEAGMPVYKNGRQSDP